MTNIATHFDMLLSVEEQERIGATPDKDDSMRVMRLLSEYNRLLEICQSKDDAYAMAKMQADNYLHAISQWADAKAMRCRCCDEGEASSPCTCFDGIAAIERAEKQLLELAPKNALP